MGNTRENQQSTYWYLGDSRVISGWESNKKHNERKKITETISIEVMPLLWCKKVKISNESESSPPEAS